MRDKKSALPAIRQKYALLTVYLLFLIAFTKEKHTYRNHGKTRKGQPHSSLIPFTGIPE